MRGWSADPSSGLLRARQTEDNNHLQPAMVPFAAGSGFYPGPPAQVLRRKAQSTHEVQVTPRE